VELSISIENLLEILEAEIVLDDGWIPGAIGSVIASDLMSDILSHGKRKSVLLTGLTNPQTVRTAEMVEIRVICFVLGKAPNTETVELARKNQIPLIQTGISMFDACGKLYKAGLKDRDNAS
jgi:hypothetical protein